MSDMFDQVASQMTADHATQSSPESTTEPRNEPSSEGAAQAEAPTQQERVEQALAELDKMEKFKFEGQEWTPQTLKEAMLRWKDYTAKTSKLSEERKSFEQERQADLKEREFAQKLHFDLETVRQNPALASKFFEIYPPKYHPAARAILGSSSQGQENTQSSQKNSDWKNDPDFQWAMQKLKEQETKQQQQDVKGHETQIRHDLDTAFKDAAKAFDDAGLEKSNICRVVVLSRAEQLRDQGIEVTQSVWKELVNEIATERQSEFKWSYGELVKKQTSANSKAQDVPPGGGIVGKAPKKYKNIDELSRDFVESVSR